MKHGDGTYRWADGREYCGQWRLNHKEGYGILTDQNGNLVYHGDFQDDDKHGTGTEVLSDGKKYRGGWKQGKQHGDGVITDVNNKVSSGKWDNGVRILWIVEGES